MWVYTPEFTIFSTSWEKTLGKTVFGSVPKISRNTISWFYTSLDHSEMSWDLVLLTS